MKTKILILSLLFLSSGFACKQKTPAAEVKPEVSVQSAGFRKMITARIFIKAGSESDFISAAQVMITNSNKEEGCLGYMLYQDPYEKTNFIFVESYKDQAAVDLHLSTPYFKEFGTRIANLISKPMEVKILDIAGEK